MPSAVEHGTEKPRREGNQGNQAIQGSQETETAGPGGARFSQEDEATLLGQSNAQKAEANKFFGSAQYSQAIGEYDKALSSCPNYLDYEVAVLKSNISACHLKLADWKAAIESASAALDALDRLTPKKPDTKNPTEEGPDNVVEVEGDDDEVQEELARLELSDQRKEDIRRIRAKALMRRARARTEEDGWGNLQGAEEAMANLPAQDKKIVQQALSTLPARINAAKEKEMGDMMGKLKEACLIEIAAPNAMLTCSQLGNGILKPFGLSTDNFKMTKDESTGGYNMSFDQGK
ncbi:MAG: hypothetical protein Q9191_000585 [Dirinaria sp. TL-2023a]